MACPGLAFHEWATEQKLTRSSDLSDLRGAQVAIDADDYVSRLLTDSVSREPLLPALGGLPMGIKKHVNNHLELFKEFNITPRFVFNGLDIATRDRTTISREARKTSDSLGEAWSLYSQSRADAAVEEFGKSCKSSSRPKCSVLTDNRHLPHFWRPQMVATVPCSTRYQLRTCHILGSSTDSVLENATRKKRRRIGRLS